MAVVVAIIAPGTRRHGKDHLLDRAEKCDTFLVRIVSSTHSVRSSSLSSLSPPPSLSPSTSLSPPPHCPYCLLSPVSGFSDKACLLMETVLLTLFTPSLYLLEDAVERQVELLKRSYSNANMKAHEAASSSRLLALAPMRYSSDAKLRALIGNHRQLIVA